MTSILFSIFGIYLFILVGYFAKRHFKATHGTAPKYAGLDKVNPTSLIMSGAMMLDHIGWSEAASLIEKGVEKAVAAKKVTYDLARLMNGAEEVSCTGFAEQICVQMEAG